MLSLLLPGTLAVLLAFATLVFSVTLQEANDPPLWFSSLCIGVQFLAVSIGWIFFVRWFASRSIVRTARRLLAEGPNRNMVGWREMELVNGRLFVNAQFLQSTLDLRGIHKIVSDGDYTYVYTDSIFAYTIPMRLYPEAEYRQFVAELREAWENRESAIPPNADSPQSVHVDDRIVER